MADRVVAVVRHREAVLSCDDEAGEGSRRLPSRSVSGDAPEAALRTLLDVLAVGSPTVERRGPPIARADGEVVPFLVSTDDRNVAGGQACADPNWAPPSGLSPETGAWRAYLAVAPTVETVAGDTERGSTAIALDALWALRDAATAADRDDTGLAPVAAVARRLLAARPSMTALANRVNRAMAGADTPAAIERAATEGIVRAHDADAAAAALAAETVGDGRVLTLSRSGTVRAALLVGRPAVDVLASRPGGEGLAVAAELTDAGLAVSSYPDAAVYDRLSSGEVDAVLVGADSVGPDGSLVNKVGTRAAALAAERAGVPCYAVCASDKIRPASGDGGPVPSFEPLFDVTPARLVTAFLTERGRLTPDDVHAVATEHRSWANWGARDGA